MRTPQRVVCAGLATLDLVQRVADFPAPDEKVTSLDAEMIAGGPAAGAAVTAAALGSPASLLTAIGRNALAGVVATDLARHGVDVVDAAPEMESAPPVSAVTVHDRTGQRCVVSRNAINRDVGVADTTISVVDDAAVLLVDGHYPEIALAAAKRAKSQGVPVLLDGGSWKPVLDELLGFVDFAVCSAVFRVPGTSAPADQGAALLDRGVPAVAVTQGDRPVLWWQAGEPTLGREIEIPRVRAVDTLGAGDVFHGAVAHAMRALDWPVQLHSVLEFASRVATLRVRFAGRESWLAALNNRDELLNFAG